MCPFVLCYKNAMVILIGPIDEQLSSDFRHSIHPIFCFTSFQLPNHRPWPWNSDSPRQSFLYFPGSVSLRSITAKMSDCPSPVQGKPPLSHR